MIAELCRRFYDTPTYKSLLNEIAEKKNVSLSGLAGSSDVVALAGLTSMLRREKRSVFIVAPDATRYAQLLDDWMTISEHVMPGEKTLLYPDDELQPYDEREINAQIAAFRQETLEQLLQEGPHVVLTSARALLRRVSAREAIESYRVFLQVNEGFDFHYLTELLEEMRFDRQDVVDHAGTFAVRGGIVDVFGFSMEDPVRIEFLGDRIESIRSFNVMTQRSLAGLESVTLFPRAEREERVAGLAAFSDYWPPDRATVLFDPDLVSASIRQFWIDAVEQHAKRSPQGAPEPDHAFVPQSILETSLAAGHQVHFCRFSMRQHTEYNFKSGGVEGFHGHVNQLRDRIEASGTGTRYFILCNNAGQVDRLNELLETDRCQPGVDYHIGVGELHEGFDLPEAALRVVTDHQIFGRGKRFRVYRRFKSAQALRHLSQFKLGDFVVHVDHGIGKYSGLEKVTRGDHVEECLKLVYQDGDKLFVPLVHFQRVQKFSAAEGVVPRLNKLGTGEWEKTKSKTKKTIKDIAQDLIKLYAERKMRKGFGFSPDSHLQYELEASFEYEDTPDQAKVTSEVKRDMESDTPMDRLVCGDVGYGKTEVAIRAAFKALQDNKQVAVLVPTTILAEQHFETFSSRLREFPVRVDVLSRFKTAKEQKTILSKTKSGGVDILIGTHRLLSKDVEFKDLGLLVVDEEQRFGVTHKERLRQIRSTVDTLTLTATPIPRSLHFSLMGGRDLSLIQTPPQDRLPIKTEITQFDEKLLHDAILQEIDRGGQVYFVHNRVQSIEQTVSLLSDMVPRARFTHIHGQMPATRVEKVVHDFLMKKYDVLVATSIIENGIDIPNVNTIFIDQAHHYGLAQLYQLRGRVGRSSRQAYCYLLTMPFSIMSHDALRRLQTIEEFSELGSGFMIAMRDLEIRGAGNLLGSQQSGFVDAVGYELYCQILEEAVNEARQEVSPEKEASAEEPIPPTQLQISVFCGTYIPETYVGVATERISLYQSLSRCTTLEQLADIRGEMIDRFGPVPVEAENLLRVVELRIIGSRFLFHRLEVDEDCLIVHYELADTSSAANDRQFRRELSWWLEREDNLRMHQERSFLELRIGMPWFNVKKKERISGREPLPEDRILGWVCEMLKRPVTDHESPIPA